MRSQRFQDSRSTEIKLIIFLYMSSKSEGRSLVSLLVERLFNQTENERNETFSTWFTYDEIDWFRDNADISKMNPLFVRYQDNMEAALEKTAAELDITTHQGIIAKLEEETGGRKGQWRVLNRMIDVMTQKEEFFVMMKTLAEKRFANGEGVSAREFDDLLFGDDDDDDDDDDDEEGKNNNEGSKQNKK